MIFHTQFDQVLLKLILSMPKLTSLGVMGPISDEVQELPQNTTISHLEVGLFGEMKFLTLIRALKGLKHLKNASINDQLLRCLARDVPALESIETRFFSVSRIHEEKIFPNIKEFKASYFMSNFEEPKGDSNFAELARKQFVSYKLKTSR